MCVPLHWNDYVRLSRVNSNTENFTCKRAEIHVETRHRTERKRRPKKVMLRKKRKFTPVLLSGEVGSLRLLVVHPRGDMHRFCCVAEGTCEKTRTPTTKEQGSRTVKEQRIISSLRTPIFPASAHDYHNPMSPSHPPPPSLALAHDASLSFPSARTSQHSLSVHLNAIPATLSSLPANLAHPNLCLHSTFSFPLPSDEEMAVSSSRFDFHSFALDWSCSSAGTGIHTLSLSSGIVTRRCEEGCD